jgi:hypothetical protein
MIDQVTFQQVEKLFHFTSIDSAIKIIISNTLRFGKLRGMNDINESYRYIFYDEGIDETSVEQEIAKYQQISLTMDSDKRQGFEISAMWGHYAEKGKGVCLVFDKDKLISLSNINDKEITTSNVIYTDEYNSNILVTDTNIPNFFTNNITGLFFQKTIDWSYEQEFRLLVKNENGDIEYLPLGESLIAVIMNYADDVEYKKTVFNSENAKILERIVPPQVKLLEFSQWDGKAILRDRNGNNWKSV